MTIEDDAPDQLIDGPIRVVGITITLELVRSYREMRYYSVATEALGTQHIHDVRPFVAYIPTISSSWKRCARTENR
jgi:hypothetical protein